MNAHAQRASGLFENIYRVLRGEIPAPDVTILPVTFYITTVKKVEVKRVRPERGIPLERKERENYGLGRSLPNGDL